MSCITLWARRDAIEPHWQLGELGEGADAMMFGWDAPHFVDGGMPAPVADAWAHALAAAARVTFLCSDLSLAPVSTEWLASGDARDFTRSAATASLLGKATRQLRGHRGSVALVCSQRAATIARAFGDATFAWWLQSQVLLLSAREAPPPAVASDTVLTLLGEDWAARAGALRDRGVVAVARPAVEGDALGLLMLDGGISEQLLAAMGAASRERGLGWASGV